MSRAVEFRGGQLDGCRRELADEVEYVMADDAGVRTMYTVLDYRPGIVLGLMSPVKLHSSFAAPTDLEAIKTARTAARADITRAADKAGLIVHWDTESRVSTPMRGHDAPVMRVRTTLEVWASVWPQRTQRRAEFAAHRRESTDRGDR